MKTDFLLFCASFRLQPSLKPLKSTINIVFHTFKANRDFARRQGYHLSGVVVNKKKDLERKKMKKSLEMWREVSRRKMILKTWIVSKRKVRLLSDLYLWIPKYASLSVSTNLQSLNINISIVQTGVGTKVATIEQLTSDMNLPIEQDSSTFFTFLKW